MIDVKKLLTGFLVVAAIAACSGLVFSLVTGKAKPAATGAQQGITLAGSSANQSGVPTTAFVDTGSLQGNAAELLTIIDTSSTDVVADDPNNLTNIFATSFVTGLTAANPNGLAMNADGTANISDPDTAAIAQTITTNPAVENLTIPDWDTEAQSQLIKTNPSASQSAIAQYGSSLSTIFNKYFISDGLQGEIGNPTTADPAQLSYISSQLQGAINDTLAVSTPAPLTSLQESLIRVMVYEKNFVLLGEASAQDPVKASLVFQGEQTKYSAAVADLRQQMSQASSLGLSLNDAPHSSVPLIAQIFGVKSAQAQWITFDPTEFAQTILEYLNNIILQILKNTLVSIIQKKVLTAIQGSGAPKFVTSFATQLITSYQSAAINAINSDITQTPPSQQLALKNLTSISYTAPNGASVLGTVGPNGTLSASGNFTNFGDYLSEFNSGGNVWANAMAIHDSALANGNSNQTANQTQNIAQSGYNADLTCPDGSDPENGDQQVCTDPGFSLDDNGDCTNAAGDIEFPETIPNEGSCPPTAANPSGQPTIILPGQTISQESNSVIKVGTENITSANDIVGLLDAMLSSLLNNLAQNAINLANSAVNGVINTQNPNNTGISGLSSSTLTNTGNTSPATQGVAQCLPAIQTATISTSTFVAFVNVSAVGGRIDTTCVANNACPTTENSDGTPIYNWSAPGSGQGGVGTTQLTGQTLTLTYSTPGTYTATVTASTDSSQSTCQINVQ